MSHTPAQDSAAGRPRGETPAGPRPRRRPRPAGRVGGKRPRVQVPLLPPPVGAAASGFLVGIGAVVLVALGMRACDALRNNPSCGGPGLIMLIAIVVALVVLGRVLLTYVKVPEPTMVSFLGVTLALVAVLAGFIEQTFSVWMWLVMPLLGAASFALCHLVLSTAAKSELDDD